MKQRSGTPRLLGIFSGPVDDRGFYQSGWAGARAACEAVGLAFGWIEGVGVGAADLAEAARTSASPDTTMVLLHGGSSDAALEIVAPEFPRTHFLSTHGERSGPNFSCTNVRQPQSAFLAGALAALTTRTGVVGHLSGIRIAPGLNARAAWAQGARHVDPGVRIVTCFCGTQDDASVAARAADRVIDAGADVLYTMLNSGRRGAIDACRSRGVPQIGNIVDWCALEPEVFIASAIADHGAGVAQWVLDVAQGRLTHGEVRWLGMEHPDAVRLHMGPRVPHGARKHMDALASDLAAGRITLQTEFAGPEVAMTG